MLNNNITSLILAGGNSSRMGQDKALLEIDEQTFLAKICDIALECTEQVYVITHRGAIYQNIVPEACQIIQEQSLFGETLPHGALFGFVQGLRLVTTEWVLLLACDLPCLSSGEVGKWIEYLKQVSSETLAVLPKTQKGWDALCGFYRRPCLPLLENYIQQGDRSFQKWLNHHIIAELPVSNQELLFNCNTPQDYAKLINN